MVSSIMHSTLKTKMHKIVNLSGITCLNIKCNIKINNKIREALNFLNEISFIKFSWKAWQLLTIIFVYTKLKKSVGHYTYKLLSDKELFVFVWTIFNIFSLNGWGGEGGPEKEHVFFYIYLIIWLLFMIKGLNLSGITIQNWT